MKVVKGVLSESGKYKLEPGDQICCHGLTVTIAEIHFQEYWERCGFITEFTDTDGNYRSWKQHIDGGTVIDCRKQDV